MNILRVDSSARTEQSKSRDLLDRLIRNLGPGHTVTRRDLSNPIPHVSAAWIAANTTAKADRTDAHRSELSLSDRLVGELENADLIAIGLPIYNFGVPAAFKAWIDQVCRARRTFAYTSDGPKGLLEGKRAVVVYVSGGTGAGSEIDFASGYVNHVLGFIGIEDVRFVDASRHMVNDDVLSRAADDIDHIASQFTQAVATSGRS